MLTAGPWRGIHLEAYDARIAEIHCPIEVATDLSRADLAVYLDIESMENAGALEAHLRLYDPAGSLLDEARVLVRDDQVRHQFVVDTPALWWPHSYGEQPLYRVVADLQEQEAVVDTQQLRVGIRRVQLVQNDSADQEGQGFCFKINNLLIFCGGANWIPADSFVPRLTPERYRAWLQLVVEANMTMLRVWGGGIYEEACFYDLYDELGILVWQDFLFACGIYPAHASFQESVRAEAEAALRRLRHHASIVVWCGNNEDYLIANSLGVYDAIVYADHPPTCFPARALYEKLLPEVCARLDPTRPYVPGSPYGGSDPNNPFQGDQHELVNPTRCATSVTGSQSG